MRRSVVRAACAALALSVLAVTAAPVGADEVRSLEAFGAPDQMVLAGVEAARTIGIPFDRAAPPIQLDGLVEHGLGDEPGTLEVRVDGVRIALIGVDSHEPTPVSIDLRGLVPAGPEATTLDVELRSRFQRSDPYCSGQATVPFVRLSELRTTFADSAEAPDSIASFFPPLLDRVVLWVPDTSDATTADAVLKLTLGLVDKYRGRVVAISVVGLPPEGLPPLAHQSAVRHVVVGDAASEHVALADGAAGEGATSARILVLPAEGLVTAALGVLQEISKLAIGPAASYQQRVGDPVVPPREQRLIDLGAPATVVVGQGTADIELTVPQAAFGGMVTAYDLRLNGRVLAEREVVVSVLVNNELVDAHRTTGTFRRRIHIEAPPLTRATTIRIEAHEVGAEGRCTGIDDPVSLQLLDDATLQATLGVTRRVSFQLLPQALLPVVDVVLSSYTPAMLDAGAALVADLAAGVPRGIGARVVPALADLAGSERPGLVVWAGPPSDLEAVGLRVPPDAPMASLALADRDGQLPLGTPIAEIARQRDRHVLIVNGPDEGSVRGFAHRLTDHPNDLTRFTGDVVVLDGDQLRDVQLTVIPDPPVERDHLLAWPAKLWLAIGATAVVVLGAAFALRALRGRRQGRPGS